MSATSLGPGRKNWNDVILNDIESIGVASEYAKHFTIIRDAWSNRVYSGPNMSLTEGLVFTCVSYAEARHSYRLDVRPSVCPSVRPSHAVLYQNG